MRLLASLIAVLVAAGCGSAPEPTSIAAPSVSMFDNDILAFEYPGNWTALVPESGDLALVLLSTERLATTQPRIEALGADGVYVAWTEEKVAPIATPLPSPRSEVEIGGRSAVVVRTAADADCAGLGGDELLTVQV